MDCPLLAPSLQTLANCVSMLKRAGKLAAGSTVVYIIPPTVGGKNKLDNFAVLPKGLLADANGENAEAYCQLMAKILGTTMMKVGGLQGFRI